MFLINFVATTNFIWFCSAQKISTYKGFNMQNLKKKNLGCSESATLF